MNRWNGYFGTGSVILFAVFLFTVFLARNGHGNPVVAGTQISVSPRIVDDAVGTRGTVSPRPTEEVAESLNANKSSPQSLNPNSKFPHRTHLPATHRQTTPKSSKKCKNSRCLSSPMKGRWTKAWPFTPKPSAARCLSRRTAKSCIRYPPVETSPPGRLRNQKEA